MACFFMAELEGFQKQSNKERENESFCLCIHTVPVSLTSK